MKLKKIFKFISVAVLGVIVFFLVQSLFKNNLPRTFFVLLMGVDNFKIEKFCDDDQVTGTENGVRNEVYRITDENFSVFLKNDLTKLPKPNPHASSFNLILTWKKNYSSSKPVAQYDLEGNFIKQYPSVRDAARQTRLDDKAIIQIAKGMYKQWNGFVWKYVQNEH